MTTAKDFEKLGAFYLGRAVDPRTDELSEAPLLYDAKDLTTHAVIVGMTGSGKTGLGVGLLEEAAIDGVPAIIVDPKGDMGNLALSFPKLRSEDFEPWIDSGAALREGRSVPEHAAATAGLWRNGLGKWDQDQARIGRYRKSAEVRIWTPGSTAGHPLTMLKSFDPPAPAVLADPEALGDRVQACTAGLLSLVGLDPDPVQSREAILIANILQHAWSEGRGLGIADLIGAIQRPPFTRLGVLDLDSFFPQSARFALAMKLNSLLASPGFAAWLEGEPLEIERLLAAPDGRPRLSVLSISHLSEEERMSFVTVLLGEVVSWLRAQPGTSSLRALLYMDEIFGYFPPTANPPSKKPMLTLLKQARAFGLGVVLSTQNPVDLDYKGLSNCGTWFLGRLQTERDKLRVLDGLEGALSSAGESFDRQTLERTLSGLAKRTFLLHNVHESSPVVFRTRWVLNYLRGPLTRQEVARLVANDKADPPTVRAVQRAKVEDEAAAAAPRVARAAAAPPEPRPSLAEGVPERFLPLDEELGEGERVVYRPALATRVKLHYALVRMKIDEWETVHAETSMAEEEPAVDWEAARFEEADPFGGRGGKRPRKHASYARLPRTIGKKSTWTRWERALKNHLYKERGLLMWKSAGYKLVSEYGETEATFRGRVRHAAVEARDLAMEKLRKRYAPKLERAAERIRKSEEKLGLQAEQLDEKKKGSWIDMGKSLLGIFMSRKKASSSNVSRAGSAMRSRTRVAKEKQDVERAERELETRQVDFEELEVEFEEALAEVPEAPRAQELEFDEVVVRPRKSDILVDPLTVVWVPWIADASGATRPGCVDVR